MDNIKPTQAITFQDLEETTQQLSNNINEKTSDLSEASTLDEYQKALDALDSKLSMLTDISMDIDNTFINTTVYRQVINSLITAYEVKKDKGEEMLGHPEITSKLSNRVLDDRNKASKMIEHLEDILLDVQFVESDQMAQDLSNLIPDTTFEDKWNVYFNELEIEFRYNEEVTLSSGETNVFSFFLPEFECYAEVFNGTLELSLFLEMRKTVIDTNTPVIMLEGAPDYTFYEMSFPDGKGGLDIKPVNVIPDKKNEGSLILNRVTASKKNYEKRGLTDVISAIEKAKS